MSHTPVTSESERRRVDWTRFLPVLTWLRHYDRRDLGGDIMAGLIVAIMLVPQSMAYALLAGLPPQVGLYASILPILIYGLLGTSRALAVGPVAIVSLMVAAAVTPLADPGSTAYLQLALTLALLTGIIQTAMGLLRVGFLVNFLSHPVLTGFTSAAALVIGLSQVKHLLGVALPRGEFFPLLQGAIAALPETNLVTAAIGLGGAATLLLFKFAVAPWVKRQGWPETVAIPVTKGAPLLIVTGGVLLVWGFGLHESAGVAIVGAVPAGLPSLSLPSFDLALWQTLLTTAFAISFVGYMESISVAKNLASKRRQKIDANQELIALGAANLGAAFTGGYPVTGGFSRSLVNFAAGANTGLASLITAGLMVLTVLILTPLFFYLPQAVLAAIIIVAAISLIDLPAFVQTWRYNRADGLSLLIAFGAVLVVGIEQGILIGAAAAMLLFVWRTSRPHAAVVGRLGDSEIYRNVDRHPVQTWPTVVALRIDESLYFANTKFLEDKVLSLICDETAVKDLILIGTAINFVDASALETLESINHQLHDAGVRLHLAAMKGPVLDRLEAVGFVDHLGWGRIHLSTHEALIALGCIPEIGRGHQSETVDLAVVVPD